MPISGQLLIGYSRVEGRETFRSYDPVGGVLLDQHFAPAAIDDVVRTCELAAGAFDIFRATDLETRARFLELSAENLMALDDELLDRASMETGLPRARLEGERARTANQLRLFADVVRPGDWLGLRVDRALPDRMPTPRSELRQRKIPLGPVVVFGASNFPLAFSSAGGDVASALAAGCPVIVKAHPSHPGTSELAASAISTAASHLRYAPGAITARATRRIAAVLPNTDRRHLLGASVSMRLSQVKVSGERFVVAASGAAAHRIRGSTTMYALAKTAIDHSMSLLTRPGSPRVSICQRRSLRGRFWLQLITRTWHGNG